LIVYKVWVYATSSSLQNDRPDAFGTWNHTASDNNFIVGRQQQTGVWVKHFQFGIESNIAITETNWRVRNINPSYYDGANWRYLPGHVTLGGEITWIGIDVYRVGNETYAGVNTYYTQNDQVGWQYTGVTIPDDTQLWSGSGIVSDIVRQPYQ